MDAQQVTAALDQHASVSKAKANAWFFKTDPGQYGAGDEFIGVTVPEQRRVAKQFKTLPLAEIEKLLHSPIHEHRLTALIIMVGQYQKGDEDTKKHIAGLYHKNRAFVNNWDLVDSSAPYILGDYLRHHSRNVVDRLAKSKSLWDRRIAVLTAGAWIREGDFDWTFKLAEQMMADREDLIHKATGWMLREVGNKDQAALLTFLDTHYRQMPRTMLRYAIERLTPDQKRHYLAK